MWIETENQGFINLDLVYKIDKCIVCSKKRIPYPAIAYYISSKNRPEYQLFSSVEVRDKCFEEIKNMFIRKEVFLL